MLVRPKVFLILILLAFFPLILSSVATPFPETIRSISNQTFKPVFQASNLFTDRITDLFQTTKSFFTIHKENQALKQKVNELQMQVYQLKEMNKKVERLEKLIPLIDANPKKVILSQIIFRDISLWNQGIIIDQGKDQGVKKNMTVISDQGLVGRVISVSSSTAQVILLTDFHSRVSVLAQDSRDSGVLIGTRSSLLKMKYLSFDSKIKVGDTIVTSGIGAIYPKGIPVGKVHSVKEDPDGLHLMATVQPFTEFSNIEEVLCLARTLKEQALFSSL